MNLTPYPYEVDKKNYHLLKDTLNHLPIVDNLTSEAADLSSSTASNSSRTSSTTAAHRRRNQLDSLTTTTSPAELFAKASSAPLHSRLLPGMFDLRLD